MSGGKIYWVEDGVDKIRRANFDGTDIKDVVTGFIWSTGISLDVPGGKIYWTDTRGKKIQRADLDGASVEDVVTGLNISTLFPAIGVAAISHETTLNISPADRQITAPTSNVDVNQDGVVDIADLLLVTGSIGQSGPNAADVNGDGVVDALDVAEVAGVINQDAAAPSLHALRLAGLTAADIREWLAQAHGLDLTDPKLQRGILFLEQLLSVLVPKETELLPNYPNPFNPETWIPYRLAEDGFVTLTIYDPRGRVIRQINVGHRTASAYESRSKAIYWDGRNQVGDRVASGIYFYTLTAGDYAATRKMVILK
jgi:hypothetical protein